jgi:hypothetical protein
MFKKNGQLHQAIRLHKIKQRQNWEKGEQVLHTNVVRSSHSGDSEKCYILGCDAGQSGLSMFQRNILPHSLG